MSKATEDQVGGDHYVNMGIQPAEYIHANRLGFLEGAIIKYASRHWRKGGAEDIKKLIHTAELLLQLEYKQEYQR
jgi:hypothetical protein